MGLTTSDAEKGFRLPIPNDVKRKYIFMFRDYWRDYLSMLGLK